MLHLLPLKPVLSSVLEFITFFHLGHSIFVFWCERFDFLVQRVCFCLCGLVVLWVFSWDLSVHVQLLIPSDQKFSMTFEVVNVKGREFLIHDS